MAADEENVDLITVGKPTDDGKAVWDVHPSHPENYEQAAGEVFISDMRPYTVFRSAGIQQKLGEKPPALRELRDQDASARLSAHEEAAAKREEARQAMLEQRGEGTSWVAPAQAAPVPQAAPEGEAEAAAAAAADPPAARMRRPARSEQSS